MARRKMRRIPGTGSVYRRSDWQKRRKPWIAEISLGLKTGGVRNRLFLGSFETEREAWDALALYQTQKDKYTTEKITVGQIWERVLAEKEKAGKNSSNWKSYWKNHISQLADVPIQDIKTLHMQDILDKSGLTSGPQRCLIGIFRAIYKLAIANDIVDKDYSQFLKSISAKPSAMHKPFTSEEMRILWQNADIPYVQIVLIQCYTGMRVQELSTLKIENAHLDEHYAIGGMKTAAGRNRMIPFADCILPFVKFFYNRALFKKSEYIFTPDAKMGLPSLKGMLRARMIYPNMLPKIGIHGHRSHDARHTFVTMADNYGMPEALQKVIIGHTSGNNITKSVYTHKEVVQVVSAVNTYLPYGTNMTIAPEENGRQVVGTTSDL